MTLIRGTALAGNDELVTERGGDPAALLGAAGIPRDAVGEYDSFVDYVRLPAPLAMSRIRRTTISTAPPRRTENRSILS